MCLSNSILSIIDSFYDDERHPFTIKKIHSGIKNRVKHTLHGNFTNRLKQT